MTQPKQLSEYEEAKLVHQWLTLQHIAHWHIPQETYTKNWGTKMKNKAQGVAKGISDYVIYISPERCKYDRAVLLWCELKKSRKTLKNGKLGASGSTVYPEQIDFIEKMNTVADVQGEICYGFNDLVDFVTRFLK